MNNPYRKLIQLKRLGEYETQRLSLLHVLQKDKEAADKIKQLFDDAATADADDGFRLMKEGMTLLNQTVESVVFRCASVDDEVETSIKKEAKNE